MDHPLTIVAIVRAQPGAQAALETALRALVEPSRRDPGCLNYDLHVADDDAGLFLFHENWRSRADWLAHMETPHLVAWKAAAPSLSVSGELLQLRMLDE